MNARLHDRGVFDACADASPDRDGKPEASRPAAARPSDVRRRPLLNEVGDSTSRHDVYHCPAAGERKR